MKVLIGCEESQIVCKAFRAIGTEAYSCDTQDCTGGKPQWHIKQDILEVINGGAFRVGEGFSFEDEIIVYKWDALIGFPPCTFLSGVSEGYFDLIKYGDKAIERWENRVKALKFFYQLYNAPIKHICLENPTGFVNAKFMKPTQIVHPYYFGDAEKKRTCFWLKDLPQLEYDIHDNLFSKRTATDEPKPIYIDYTGMKRYFSDAISGTGGGGKARSKTFPGIARAMATQWGDYIKQSALHTAIAV